MPDESLDDLLLHVSLDLIPDKILGRKCRHFFTCTFKPVHFYGGIFLPRDS